MPVQNIKLVLAYNGAAFSGWQRQNTEPTLQETVEESIKKITGEKIILTGCGRTDGKVHALSYTANFKTSSSLSPGEFKNALNAKLPRSIRIKSAAMAEEGFHSRYDAKRKTYRYIIICGERSPFLEGLACFVKEPLDIEKMKKASRFFIGKQDFSAFQASGSDVKNTIRRIYKISVRQEKFTIAPEIKLISVEISANGFLYKMARNIIGTLIYVGKGKLSAGDIPAIIKSGNRKKTPPTAPPEGLYMKNAIY